MTKKFLAILTVLVIGSMLIAACAPATEEPTEAPEATEVTEEPTQEPPAYVCQITDTGGIDDRSFNETAWRGIQDAVDEFGIRANFLESQEVADYETNINAFIQEGCDLIITVGFLIADATAAAAEANPDQKFSIVDFAFDPVIPNVVGQVFETDEAAFLAGYVAADVTETGIVGTFGGLPIPTVTIFMDGFVAGVEQYNEDNGTDVQVLGWDPETETGSFTNSFDDQQLGRETAVSLMDEGADIIMPVAGPVGLGAAAAIQERGNAYIIGVDSDWFLTSPEYAEIILTSVMKRMDSTTFLVIEDVIEGTFEGGTVVGTLENEGVAIAPFHDNADLISDELQTRIDELRQAIIDGEIVLE